jgi:hypothetical protein
MRPKITPAGSRTSGRGSSGGTSVGADHEARISALEKHVVALTAPGGAAATTVTVVFDLDKKGNTAKFSRLYFVGHDEDLVNNMDKPHAELPNQPLGSTIQLMMEVRGDDNQTGSFTVKAATPTPVTLKVSDGPKSPILLFVSG